MTTATSLIKPGRYDANNRRRATRAGRKRGSSIYIPLEELVKAGYSPDEPPPFYRVWVSLRGRGGLFVRLYRER